VKKGKALPKRKGGMEKGEGEKENDGITRGIVLLGPSALGRLKR